MEFEVINKNKDELVFMVNGADIAFVNAIRRICMMEVPTIAIDDVNLVKNDSAMFNEVLAHRLGLLPIASDIKSIEGLVMPDECDCGEYCPQCSVPMTLNKKGPCVVYSKDLESLDQKIKPVYDTIPLLKLKEDEEVCLEAYAQLGIGKEHAKWQPTIVCAYKFYPELTFGDECTSCGNCAGACPRGVLQYNNNKVEIMDLTNCSMCKSCYRACDDRVINISFDDSKFIFKIETDGSIPPEEVLLKACDVLSDKADKIIEIV